MQFAIDVAYLDGAAHRPWTSAPCPGGSGGRGAVPLAAGGGRARWNTGACGADVRVAVAPAFGARLAPSVRTTSMVWGTLRSVGPGHPRCGPGHRGEGMG